MTPSEYDGYQFGRFEVRVRDGMLFRDQERVKIEELPFQLLLVLLESPGEVVSKETLRSRLWSDRVFGELDNVLQVAAAKLREALGERAGAGGHIETIRRRGYRFNGDVEPLILAPTSTPTEAPPIGVVDEQGGLLQDAPVLSPAEPRGVAMPPRKRYLWTALAIFVALLVGAAAFFFYKQPRGPLLGSSDIIVLGGFANNTGEDSYGGLAQAFRVKLEESPYLNLLAEQQFLRQVPEPAKASLEQLLSGCRSLGGRVLITGKIAARLPGYEVTTEARSCADGRLLTTQAANAEGRDSVLAALDQAANQMRRGLGESSDSLQRFNMPLAQATTSSLAALRAFTLGEEKRDNGQEFEAIRDYKLAIDLDPRFALAYARLGTIYSNAAEQTQSAEQFKKAFDLREHTTDRERLYITAHYYSISGETQRTIEAYELWRSLYPRDSLPDNNLAIEYRALGETEKAAVVARDAIRLDPNSSLSQSAVARVYLETGQQAQLQTLCDNGRKSGSAMLHESCFLLAFLRKDEDAMQEQIAWSRGSAAESEVLDDVAWVAMYQGKLNSGRKLFAQARQAALIQGFSELAATIDTDEAVIEADFGYPKEARALALDALKLAPKNVSIQASAALALGRSGDVALAEVEATRAAEEAPRDTILNAVEIPSIHAAIQLQKHAPLTAIQILEPVRPYDRCSAMNLAPAYYRGLAFQEAKDPRKAAAEFRSVLEHRAIMPDSPYIPLAAIQLGQVLRKLGNTEGAESADGLVHDAWQHADSAFLPLRRQQGN